MRDEILQGSRVMDAREEKYFRQGLLHGQEQKVGGVQAAKALRGMLADAMKMTAEDAATLAVKDYRRRLDALPSTARYPELAGMRECVCAYNSGVAQGMGVALEDVMIRANFITMVTRALRVGDAKNDPPRAKTPGCTLVYFPESDRGPILANNQDGVSASAHKTPPGWIVSNKAGIILGTVSSGLFNDEQTPEEFPAPVFMMVSELCTTTAQAVDLLTRLTLFWGPMNLLIADSRGASAVIEKSTCRYGLRTSPDGFIGTTEMSAEEPTYKRFLWDKRISSLAPRGLDESSVDWAYWKVCEKRSARLMGLIDAARKQPTYAAAQRIIYDHTGEVEQVHMCGMPCHRDQKPEECEWSLRTTLWTISEGKAEVSFAEPPKSSRETARVAFDYRGVELVF
jgi:hypothetical protein